jgi:hypothetical protein
MSVDFSKLPQGVVDQYVQESVQGEGEDATVWAARVRALEAKLAEKVAVIEAAPAE